MEKRDQDQLLWNIAGKVKGVSHRSWEFLGKRVCRTSIFILTGASHRLQTFRTAQQRGQSLPPMDLRTLEKPPTMGKQSTDVNNYLQNLYWSAETIMYVKDCTTQDVETCSTMPIDDQLVVVYDKALGQLENAADKQARLSIVSTGVGAAHVCTEGKRYLPPGTWTDEYKIYNLRKLLKQEQQLMKK